ncbi:MULTISPECIES: glutathione S-transferase family protein [Enterobacteriaceae]|uniref:glutathione S-transferase family protein n=1 Tax=Enterobacteriaceae TaxID=543 RepID=UPI000237D08F|nr:MULTISPECIES: glutathione S-transferase [Enterobacteriaceae]QNE50917.1 glutathione S-transferase [Klebsiella michiganensis]
MSDIILHHFDASPFAKKLRLIFGLKRLEWQSVEAELIMPKPRLTALTGGYRKTPVMQIGADIYCDSRLIAVELERRFPTPTIFPGGNRGLAIALSSWSDRDLHIASSGLSIGNNIHQFPENLMRDRKAYFGDFMPVDQLEQDIPHLTTQLRAHVDLVEQQLSDGRHFLLGDEPGLVDFQAYVEIETVLAHVPSVGPVLAAFFNLNGWLNRVQSIGSGKRTEITSDEAHEIARISMPDPQRRVDRTDALDLVEGDTVTVTPDDYGREPVTGRLAILTTHEVAIERDDAIVGTVVVHFPRIGFRVSQIN